MPQTSQQILDQLHETRLELQTLQTISNGITARALYFSANMSTFTVDQANRMADYLEHLQLVTVKLEYLDRQLSLALAAERAERAE